MDSVGAEVGQKMRSAIKAKLMELDCYVDDELPDYIMVMVANRRTKSQMNEDLNLFLSAKTSTFVNWLHIVLKKLKQVTVTNPEVYKKAIKRKGNNNVVEQLPNNVEKVKDEKVYKKVKKEEKLIKENDDKYHSSMTDNLPIIGVNKLSGNRKIVVETTKTLPIPSLSSSLVEEINISEDNFDIPLLSEVNDSVNEENLQEIEKKIRNVKTRLGLLVDSEDDERNVKLEEKITKKDDNNTNKIDQIIVEKVPHKRITFESDDDADEEPVKKSVKSRLGRRFSGVEISKTHNIRNRSRSPINRSRNKSPNRDRRSPVHSREQSNKKTNILSRLGVQSKVEIVVKKPPLIIAEVKAKKNDIENANKEEEEEELKVIREVQSSIKVKPRVIPQNMPQANKNLLLKAVAEAQRSIAQTRKVGRNVVEQKKPSSLYTKKFTEKPSLKSKEIAEKFKGRLESIIKRKPDEVHCAKTLDINVEEEEEFSKNTQQQFIITLDGLNELDLKEDHHANDHNLEDGSIKSTEENKRSHSPIIFSKNEISINNIKINKRTKTIPDTLPLVHPSVSVKKKERCKYWPVCSKGDKCEYVHPTENCKTFPLCKYGKQCLYTHPTCKFRTSCTKRDCSYEHNNIINIVDTTLTGNSKIQYCKFYPNCSNVNCAFVHPQLGQNFGNYFKNVKWTAK